MTDSKRLGRGLEALLGPTSKEQAAQAGLLRDIAVNTITPNPFQPRRIFDDSALDELASSIAGSGLLQPITVRSVGNRFELIAGERRWRATQRLGWSTIPAIVRDYDDKTALTAALVENLQRDDLSAVDAAHGYQRLIDDFNISASDVAKVVGKNRSTVANTLRLLKLPLDVQGLIQERRLAEGHARALLTLDDPAQMSRMAQRTVEHGWSVRDVEAAVRGDAPAASATPPPDAPSQAPPRGNMMKKAPPQRTATADARRIEDALRKRLGTDVRVTAKRRGRGLVTISYYSNDDLARVIELILGHPFHG